MFMTFRQLINVEYRMHFHLSGQFESICQSRVLFLYGVWPHPLIVKFLTGVCCGEVFMFQPYFITLLEFLIVDIVVIEFILFLLGKLQCAVQLLLCLQDMICQFLGCPLDSLDWGSIHCWMIAIVGIKWDLAELT
jgi:hypothetical protein